MRDMSHIRTFETTSRLRLRGFDYSTAASYFVTCVAKNRDPIFGEVHRSQFTASELGNAILNEWIGLEAAYETVMPECCQLMPDHFHGIITLHTADIDGPPSLSAVIGRFKSLTARRYWEVRDAGRCADAGTTCWQDRFHDKIIRDDGHYEELVMYMALNPHRWTQSNERT